MGFNPRPSGHLAMDKPQQNRMTRFLHLEVGVASAQPAAQYPAVAEDRVICRHCGELNEQAREICLKCYKPLARRGPASFAEVTKFKTLVINGRKFTSDDANLPPAVKTVMDRMDEPGFNAAQAVGMLQGVRIDDPIPAGTQVFVGDRASYVIWDGRTYLRDAADMPEEARGIFSELDAGRLLPAGDRMGYWTYIGGAWVPGRRSARQLQPAVQAAAPDFRMIFSGDPVEWLKKAADAAKFLIMNSGTVRFAVVAIGGALLAGLLIAQLRIILRMLFSIKGGW